VYHSREICTRVQIVSNKKVKYILININDIYAKKKFTDKRAVGLPMKNSK